MRRGDGGWIDEGDGLFTVPVHVGARSPAPPDKRFMLSSNNPMYISQ